MVLHIISLIKVKQKQGGKVYKNGVATLMHLPERQTSELEPLPNV